MLQDILNRLDESKTVRPEWVEEIHQKLDKLQITLEELKEQLNPAEKEVKEPPPPKTIIPFRRAMHDAIYAFVYKLPDGVQVDCYEALLHKDLDKVKDEGALSSKDIDGINLILLFLQNILKQPNNPRYRRLSTQNTSYKTSLQSLPSHRRVLEAVGFQQAGSYFEWRWSSLLDDSASPLPASSSSSSAPNILSPLSPSGGGEADGQPERQMVLPLLGEAVELLSALKEGGRERFFAVLASQRDRRESLSAAPALAPAPVASSKPADDVAPKIEPPPSAANNNNPSSSSNPSNPGLSNPSPGGSYKPNSFALFAGRSPPSAMTATALKFDDVSPWPPNHPSFCPHSNDFFFYLSSSLPLFLSSSVSLPRLPPRSLLPPRHSSLCLADHPENQV